MSFYELTFIARQEISTSACEALTDRLIGLVEEQGGKTYKREYWGLRALAYRIRKNRKGHYVHLGLEISGEAVHELERKMRLDDDVLRYMTLKVPATETEPSPMMLARSDEKSETSGDSRSSGSPRGASRHRGDSAEGTSTQEKVAPQESEPQDATDQSEEVASSAETEQS